MQVKSPILYFMTPNSKTFVHVSKPIYDSEIWVKLANELEFSILKVLSNRL